jgi:hypothetical protein
MATPWQNLGYFGPNVGPCRSRCVQTSTILILILITGVLPSISAVWRHGLPGCYFLSRSTVFHLLPLIDFIIFKQPFSLHDVAIMAFSNFYFDTDNDRRGSWWLVYESVEWICSMFSVTIRTVGRPVPKNTYCSWFLVSDSVLVSARVTCLSAAVLRVFHKTNPSEIFFAAASFNDETFHSTGSFSVHTASSAGR